MNENLVETDENILDGLNLPKADDSKTAKKKDETSLEKEEEEDTQKVTPPKAKTAENKTKEKQEDDDEDDEASQAADEESDQEESAIQLIAKELSFDYTLSEEDQFDDSYSGIAKFVEKVAEDRAEGIIGELREEYPALAEFMDHLLLGGDSESFFSKESKVDYSKVTLKDNPNSQKAVLTALFRKNEYSEEEAGETVSKYEAAGLLESESVKALAKLQAMQQKEDKAEKDQKEKDQKQRQERIKEYWGKVEQTVNSGKAKGFNIPQPDRKDLFKYMALPVKGGKSQEMLDMEQEDMETRVFLAFLRKNKFNVAKYIEQAAATKKATDLKTKLASHSEKAKGAHARTETGTNLPDIGLEFLMK